MEDQLKMTLQILKIEQNSLRMLEHLKHVQPSEYQFAQPRKHQNTKKNMDFSNFLVFG